MKLSLKKYFDLRLILILSAAYGFMSLISFVKNYYLKIHGKRFAFMNWSDLVINIHLYDWLYVVIFMVIIAASTKFMIERRVKWVYIISIHFIASFFIGVFVFFAASITGYLLGTIAPEYLDLDYNLTRYFSVLHINFLIYFSLTGIIYIYYYFIEEKNSAIQKLKLEKEVSTSKMLALKSHLHPHFLFNALNSIHSLMSTDVQRSQNMVVDLSDLLREMIDIRNKNLIKLEEELRLLHKYLSIQKTRFSDDLQVEINIADNLGNTRVPAMIIQPIIENAIKHGYSKKHINIEISITVFQDEAMMVYQIKNNGKPLEKPFKHLLKNGMGLKNIIERLNALYGEENCSFKGFNHDDKVITEIRFPVSKK